MPRTTPLMSLAEQFPLQAGSYPDLARHQRDRRRCAARIVLARIAGGADHVDSLLHDLTGGVLPDAVASAGAILAASKQDASQSAREARVNIAQVFVGLCANGQLSSWGMDVSRRVYDTASAHAATNGGLYCETPRTETGRNEHDCKDLIEAAWIAASVPAGKSIRGVDVRQVIGPLAPHVHEIASRFLCSTTTAWAYMPKSVKIGTKMTNLCLYCERLLQLRKDAVAQANSLGGCFENQRASFFGVTRVHRCGAEKLAPHWEARKRL